VTAHLRYSSNYGSQMEALLRRELSLTELKPLRRASGGFISESVSYETDSGRIFVKYNVDKNVSGRGTCALRCASDQMLCSRLYRLRGCLQAKQQVYRLCFRPTQCMFLNQSRYK
jgi:hypothetical protein